MYFSRSRIRLISGLLFLVTNHTRKEKVFLTKRGEKMLYEISGNQDAPVILMFPGSFGSARSMQGYMDLLKEKYYVIGVTLDGCDGSGNSYTSKDDVTDKVLQKVKEMDISRICLLYGLSMGGANALNYLFKCSQNGITVDNILLDGAKDDPFYEPKNELMKLGLPEHLILWPVLPCRRVYRSGNRNADPVRKEAK